MRLETDTGVLLYWPPHEGILYCAAGPVSRNVPIVALGTKGQLGAVKEAVKGYRSPWLVSRTRDGMAAGLIWNTYEPECTYRLKLAPEYRVTFRIKNVRRHSPEIPDEGEFVMR